MRNSVYVVFFRKGEPESFMLVSGATPQIIAGLRAAAEMNGQRIILQPWPRILQLFPDTAQLWKDVGNGY